VAQSKTDTILAKLEEIRAEQHQTAVEVRDLVVHVKGNGGKGLHQRMNKAEEWIAERPAKCPLDVVELDRSQRRRIAIVGIILAAITIGVNVILQLIGKVP